MTCHNIDLEWVLLLLIYLYKSIYLWKIDDKDITNVNKLVTKMV